MTNQTICITVAHDGQTKVETHGFTGPACQTASKFIEEALGKTTSEHCKPEYFTDINNHNHLEASQ